MPSLSDTISIFQSIKSFKRIFKSLNPIHNLISLLQMLIETLFKREKYFLLEESSIAYRKITSKLLSLIII